MKVNGRGAGPTEFERPERRPESKAEMTVAWTKLSV